MDEPGDWDWLIVGSGFGGSVAALRLSEKGYRVAVLEQGRRFRPEDFPRSNWNIRKFLWAPRLGCRGIQAITLLRDVFVLHGAGVGGGSLVYANTLLVPPDEVFGDPSWNAPGDWKRDLAPHYETAKRMLGVVRAPKAAMGPGDRMLGEIAEETGRGASFAATEVGIHFGEAGRTVADPYFYGAGPPRTGCTLCGGCMTGCRVGAKNTLDRNYLHLAEGNGAVVVPDTRVVDVRELPEGGYEVETRSTRLFGARRKHRTRGVVLAAGVLGTVPLLARCRERGSLPRIPPRLGHFVRTNSEALVGVRARSSAADHSTGIAIASGFRPDEATSVEAVRYGAGHDAMALLGTPLVPADGPVPRPIRWLAEVLLHPLRALRLSLPFGWARRTVILLVMQTTPNHLRLEFRRRWWWPFAKRLTSFHATSEPVPRSIPAANEIARRLAAKMDGDPIGVLPETLLDLSSTAHILGGCPIGRSAEDGVVDRFGRVFGHENLLVTDGSIVPVNLSVNPSLTITALAEHAMAAVPAKGAKVAGS